jgi:site-specific recombinase XerD
MSVNQRQKQQVEHSSPELPSWLSAVEKDLLGDMLESWRNSRFSRGNELSTVKGDQRVLLDFVDSTRTIPGQSQPEHFSAWSTHLGRVRRVGPGTQRKYQAAVRCFFDYLVRTPRLRNLVRSSLGLDIVQVSTPDNSVIHRRDREVDSPRPRTALTDDESAALFENLERQIAIAYRSGSKSLHALQRDKVMFALVLDGGLRNMEITGVNLSWFKPNPKFEEFGKYGLVTVFGKGRKWRTLPLFDPCVAKALDWYVENVRPRFLANAAPDEDALFLSERGQRLSRKSYWQRFKKALDYAGLPHDIVPYTLRHTATSNEAMSGLSIEANRLRRGHKFTATTQGYTHLQDSFVEAEFERIIRRKLR